MSLIPSESYSFPDHFTTTVVPSRKPKKEQSRKAPLIVPLPDPPREKAIEPQPRYQEMPVASPNPAVVRASAPPPRIPTPIARKHEPAPILRPKSVTTARVPAMDPSVPAQRQSIPAPLPAAANVIPMRPERPVAQSAEIIQPVPPQPRPRPAPVVTTSQADFFELFAQNGDDTFAKRRRKMKFRRFMVYEGVVLAVLLPAATVGVLYHPTNAFLHWTLNILTIASAITAALIPISFYAFTPTLPEIER